MAFRDYEERRGKIKLSYVELLANKLALQDILGSNRVAEDPSPIMKAPFCQMFTA